MVEWVKSLNGEGRKSGKGDLGSRTRTTDEHDGGPETQPSGERECFEG